MSITIPLSGTTKGVISVTKIEEPYGPNTASVASVGISLDGNTENPEWKVHIPIDNIDEVVTALQKLK
ncbi:MAG: hypothetical protein ABXS93_02020 [Sulfurimonas sp.]